MSLGDNPNEAMAGLSAEEYRKRSRALRLRRTAMTPEQREEARRQRSRVCSAIAEQDRYRRRLAETQRPRPDVVVSERGSR